MKKELNKGAILLISGPSGCGKSSMLKELYKQINNYYFSISTTTRDPRDNEINGQDYYFVTKAEFEIGIKNGDFLEYATVHNNYYGTSLKPIQEALKDGKLVIFDIDVQGHTLVRKQLDDITTSVFIATPTAKELENRLLSRQTDTIETINTRLINAKHEIKELSTYDYFIINDNLKEASKYLVAIAFASLCKTKLFGTTNIITKWSR